MARKTGPAQSGHGSIRRNLGPWRGDFNTINNHHRQRTDWFSTGLGRRGWVQYGSIAVNHIASHHNQEIAIHMTRESVEHKRTTDSMVPMAIVPVMVQYVDQSWFVPLCWHHALFNTIIPQPIRRHCLSRSSLQGFQYGVVVLLNSTLVQYNQGSGSFTVQMVSCRLHSSMNAAVPRHSPYNRPTVVVLMANCGCMWNPHVIPAAYNQQ
jgi:hypothetical protein